MTALSFRSPQPSDLDALCALGRLTFIETFGTLYSATDLNTFLDQAFGPPGLPLELVDPAFAFQIVESQGAMIGYCKVGPPHLPLPDDGRRQCELRQLYIVKAWHGAGIAGTLMSWVLAWAERGGFEDMYLSVWSENHRAQKLYLKYGFERVGDLKFMVGEHVDHDFLFRLRLKG